MTILRCEYKYKSTYKWFHKDADNLRVTPTILKYKYKYEYKYEVAENLHVLMTFLDTNTYTNTNTDIYTKTKMLMTCGSHWPLPSDHSPPNSLTLSESPLLHTVQSGLYNATVQSFVQCAVCSLN